MSSSEPMTHGASTKDDDCPLVAASEGNLEWLKHLLAEQGGSSINQIDDHGMTCTMLAAKGGHLEVLRYLVDEQGAECGKTCLKYAASEGHLEVLKYLVEQKRVAFEFGEYDRHNHDCYINNAIKKGDLSMVEFLANAGLGLKPEHAIRAATHGQLEILRYLVDVKGVACGNDQKERFNKTTCVLGAAESGVVEVMQYLVEEKGLDCGGTIRDRNGLTCTMVAANEGHIEMLQYLMDDRGMALDFLLHEPDLNWVSKAAKKGNLRVLKYLVDEKKFPIPESPPSSCSRTWPQEVAALGHLDVLRYLVEEKSFPCGDVIRDPMFRKTTAMYAAEFGRPKVLTYLVDQQGARCDDTVTSEHNMTCAMHAASGNGQASDSDRIEVLKYLVEKGAVFNNTSKDEFGRTCVVHATEGGQRGVVMYLEDQKL